MKYHHLPHKNKKPYSLPKLHGELATAFDIIRSGGRAVRAVPTKSTTRYIDRAIPAAARSGEEFRAESQFGREDPQEPEGEDGKE